MLKVEKVISDNSFFTRANVDASTIVDNENERTFEVVFATENPVFRKGWDENFNEILSLSDGAIRTARLSSGSVPLLNNHSVSDGIENQLGRVIEFKIVKDEARATILFSNQDKWAGVWKDIRTGVLKSISTGYNVFKYMREPVGEGEVPNYRAIDWEPLEISLTPIPADYKSHVRSENSEHEILIENLETRNMTVEKTDGANAPENKVAETLTEVKPVNESAVRSAAIAAERERVKEITSAVRSVQLDESFAATLIDSGTSIEDARAKIINKLAEGQGVNFRNAAPISTTIKTDEVDNTRSAMVEGLLYRSGGVVKVEGKAQDYRYSSMMDLAKECLHVSGQRTLGFSADEIIVRAIATTDFPNLLNSTVERAIRTTYNAIAPTWKHIAAEKKAKDFRATNGIAVDGSVTFDEIAEGGEYKEALVLKEDTASLKLKTFGRKITITRQAIVNDDLQVFNMLPQMIASGAANFQADKVWGLLTSNAKAPDGVAMFHATHGNLAGSGAVLSASTLNAARVAMYKQKTPAGNQLSINALYLVVPIELEMTALQLVASVQANSTSAVNPFAGKYTVVVDPRMTSPTAWYLSADPKQVEGLVYAYLQGQEGLYIAKEVSFDNESVTTKARLDFDCQVWGYRGWYKNAGA